MKIRNRWLDHKSGIESPETSTLDSNLIEQLSTSLENVVVSKPMKVRGRPAGFLVTTPGRRKTKVVKKVNLQNNYTVLIQFKSFKFTIMYFSKSLCNGHSERTLKIST